jgi:DNA invertase Pin-like site-specific DNA recombinase
MIFGYARVSKREQNLALQINALKKSCYKEIYLEKVSGRTLHRI